MAARLGGIHETNLSALLLPHLLFFLCLPEGAPGTLQPLFLPPARGEIAACVCTGITVPTHGRRCRVWSGWGVAGGSGLGWSGAGWLQREGPPRRLLLAEQPLREALSVKQKETENFWAEVLAGFGGITWLGADLARVTAQARAYGRKHSLHRLCLGGS